MEDVRKALAVSIGSRGFSALLGLAALPLYVRLLGIEAYGVVGLFASMQVLVAFLDFGLGTTLTRELSGVGRDPGRLARGRDVAATFEAAYAGVAIVIGALLVAAGPLVASRWVNLQSLGAQEVSAALQLAGVALACQWPANLYSAGMSGLHRQTALAVSSSSFAALRVALSLLALWFSPTLESFFWSQIASGLVQSVGMRLQMWRALALPGHKASARMDLVHRSRAFAGGMTAITLTSIVLVQVDRVILSYLLPLSDFGVYFVASTLASGLYILISPVFSVIYPRLSALWSAADLPATVRLYHASSQAMAALILPLALVMAFFPAEALFVLTGDPALSARGGPILCALVLGGALNGLMNIPYAMQLAAGWTRLTIATNLVAIAVLVPLTWWSVTLFGVTGGAVAWLGLNVGYFILTPQLMHHRLLRGEKLRWYVQDNLRPALAALAVAALALLVHEASVSRWTTTAQLAFYWAAATAATMMAVPGIRGEMRKLWAVQA
jgi:O-antigen/teichoic acid export membrane protein